MKAVELFEGITWNTCTELIDAHACDLKVSAGGRAGSQEIKALVVSLIIPRPPINVLEPTPLTFCATTFSLALSLLHK